MKDIHLIIETPRAGEIGHCFIVSPDLTNESQVAHFVGAASRHPIGQNYIAQARRVEQRLSNGTVRCGDEILVLIGVNVPSLSDSERERIRQTIEQFADRVDALIHAINWHALGGHTIITRTELYSWLQEPGLAGLPITSSDCGPIAESIETRAFGLSHYLGMIAGVIVAAAILVVILYWIRANKPDRSHDAGHAGPIGLSDDRQN